MRYELTEANLFLIDLFEVFSSLEHVFEGEFAPWHIEPSEDSFQDFYYLGMDVLLQLLVDSYLIYWTLLGHLLN